MKSSALFYYYYSFQTLFCFLLPQPDQLHDQNLGGWVKLWEGLAPALLRNNFLSDVNVQKEEKQDDFLGTCTHCLVNYY